MTKVEMFAELEALPRYRGLVSNDGVVDTNAAGDNQYRLTVRVVDGFTIDYQHLFFWVIDDGGPAEAAYFQYRDSITSAGSGFIDVFGT